MAAAGEIARRLGDRLQRGIAVYAGPGNNGGDAWVVSGALASAGVRVRVRAVGDPNTPDAVAERAAARDLIEPEAPLGSEAVVVDGLLGTGSHGAPRDGIRDAIVLIREARERGAIVVSLDVPSGVDATTGSSQGAVRADLTLTFGTLKRGLAVARNCAGVVAVLDIGLGTYSRLPDNAPTLVDAGYVRDHVPPISADANKGTRRRIAVVGGGDGMAGAVILAARAALASGVGLVRLFVAPDVVAIVQSAGYEALAGPWPVNDEVVKHEIEEWADALLLGPGLGRSATAVAVAERVLRATRIPTVVDADGLNAFAGRPEALGSLLAGRPALVTPHPAEFGRLADISVEEVLSSRFEVGQGMADRLGATVLLKGVPTVISAPASSGQGGARYVSCAGSPVLAVGGSGDLLSGIVTTLLAQTGDPLASAGCAAWVHGTAAELAGRGQVRGVVLDDVLRALPLAWQEEVAETRYPVLAELSAVGESSTALGDPPSLSAAGQ
jgi:ADP-dependent NAD(P)H-hydrate dehydratase / NAD(P)H-hydrate epimerase